MKSDAIVGALKAAALADVDVDEALDQLSDLVDLAHSKPVKQNPDVVLSEVPLGPDTTSTCVVGWDTCFKCHLMVSNCSCKGGPVEPDYVRKFRQDKLPTPVSKAVPGKSASPSSQVPVSSDVNVEIDPDNPGSMPSKSFAPRCTACSNPTTPETADQNDDQSWTCHTCQEASA